MNEEKVIRKLLIGYLKNKEKSKCPDDLTLALFIEKKLPLKEEKMVIDHLITCKDCRDVVIKANNLSQKENIKLFKPKNKKNLKKFLIPVSLAASVLLAFFLYTENTNKDKDIFIPKGKTAEEDKTIKEKLKEELEKLIQKIKRVFENED